MQIQFDDQPLQENNILLYNLVQFILDNSLLNTYITTVDEDSEFSIILKTKSKTMNNILKHLGKYEKINKNDTILDDKCSICYDDYHVGEYKRNLNKCGHNFHKKCIDKWFKKNKDNMSCPVCRKNYNKKIEL
jgi:hypothetical protein